MRRTRLLFVLLVALPIGACSRAPQAGGEVTVTLKGKEARFAVDGAAAFDMANGSGINLLVGCTGAASGCALSPSHGGALNALAGCPGGRLVILSFKKALGSLPPGDYSQDGPVAATAAVMWSESGEMQMTADSWASPIGRIEQINEREVRGAVDAHYVDGSTAIKGTFTAPVCPPSIRR
jgi:hypothetical protein